MTTKEQERKALAKIAEIIDGIGGADSYIGMALEGCLEVALNNIENDFADSYKSRYEHQLCENEKLQHDNEEIKKELELAKVTMHQEAERANRLAEESRKIEDVAVQENSEKKEAITKLEAATRENEALKDEIIKLKAKLYDMMVGA